MVEAGMIIYSRQCSVYKGGIGHRFSSSSLFIFFPSRVVVVVVVVTA
jgi:hypothetical protein